jgi:protein-tyrosine phosphatase
MPEVIDWRPSADRSVIHRAAQALMEGRLVIFPTETVYGIAASPFSPIGVERLISCKGRPEDKPLPLAIESSRDATDWLPELSPLGRRLAKRCWPGPVTLVSGDGLEQGLTQRLPESVRRRVCPAGTIGLRVPAHDAILEVVRELAGPLVLSSANRSGEPDAVTLEQALQAVGDNVDVAIADGPCRLGRPSTVVRVDGRTWKILREGIVMSTAIQRLSACLIVFVCTGNTCRSPLAEALFKKMLADRLGCQPQQLAERGFVVRSAGLAAVSGAPAAAEAVLVAKERDADLEGHLSRPLHPDLAAHADYILAMTHAHLTSIGLRYPDLGSTPRLLCPEGEDVPDPLGADCDAYRQCARQIESCLEKFLPEVEEL